MQYTDIIKAMEDHARDYGPSVQSIGQMAVKNRHAYERIKRGTAHRDTGRRIIEWIKEDRLARMAKAGDAA